jgi:hypothetical protein
VRSLTLPRPLVLELLHLAQAAPKETIRGLIIRPQQGGFALRPLPDQGSLQQLLRDCAALGEAPFACYCSTRAGAEAVPAADELAHWRHVTRLMLTVSLGTKGVLQLQAWESAGRQLTALPVTITDASTPP